MNDNYYIDDLISSLKKEVVMKRYYPLINHKEELIAIMNKYGVTTKDQVFDAPIQNIRITLGENISRLFSRYIHIYDFNKSKLREIKDYIGTKEYDTLVNLLRLPGVRLLRAKLYYNSGITLKELAEKSTEDIRSIVKDYIQRENRLEIVPQPKEVNCHREVAKMILHTDNQYIGNR